MAAEKGAQRVELSAAGVSRAEKEVLKAVKALEEVESELSKQKDALKEVRITQKTVAENVGKSRKAMGEVTNLQRQAQRFDEKLGHLRKQAKAKGDASDAALADMQSQVSAEEVRPQLMLHIRMLSQAPGKGTRAIDVHEPQHHITIGSIGVTYT